MGSGVPGFLRHGSKIKIAARFFIPLFNGTANVLAEYFGGRLAGKL